MSPIATRTSSFFDTSFSSSPFSLSSGCSIAIHSLYGLSIWLRRPYSDTHADAHTNTFDDLDLLAMFHSVVQVVVLILGLAANEGNAVTVSVLVFIFAAAGMAASAVVSALSLRAQKNKKKSDNPAEGRRSGDIGAIE